MKRFKILITSLLLCIIMCVPTGAATYYTGWGYRAYIPDNGTEFYITINTTPRKYGWVYARAHNASDVKFSIYRFASELSSKDSHYYGSTWGDTSHNTESKFQWYKEVPDPTTLVFERNDYSYATSIPDYAHIYINHPSHNIQTRSFTKGVDLL